MTIKAIDKVVLVQEILDKKHDWLVYSGSGDVPVRAGYIEAVSDVLAIIGEQPTLIPTLTEED